MQVAASKYAADIERGAPERCHVVARGGIETIASLNKALSHEDLDKPLYGLSVDRYVARNQRACCKGYSAALDVITGGGGALHLAGM
jgi:hypothetical protein